MNFYQSVVVLVVMLRVESESVMFSPRGVPVPIITTRTSLLAVDVDLDVGLLEGAPLEVLPVAAALNLALRALLAARLLFAAFQSLGLARYAACEWSRSVHGRPARARCAPAARLC